MSQRLDRDSSENADEPTAVQRQPLQHELPVELPQKDHLNSSYYGAENHEDSGNNSKQSTAREYTSSSSRGREAGSYKDNIVDTIKVQSSTEYNTSSPSRGREASVADTVKDQSSAGSSSLVNTGDTSKRPRRRHGSFTASPGDDALVAKWCDTNNLLLWRWLTWHVAQHCVHNKLRTTLGKPQDTFMLIEGKNRVVNLEDKSGSLGRLQWFTSKVTMVHLEGNSCSPGR